MALGYCLGRIYDRDWATEARRKLLLQAGAASLLAFVLLRWANLYGDPAPWSRQREPGATVMSFFNVEKYPPSLLYLCLTLGVALLLLGALEGRSLRRGRPIVTFGKVALFYYVAHLFHAAALLAVVLAGYPWHTTVFLGSQAQPSPLLKGRFGFGLAGTQAVWAAIVVLMYPLCARWNALKARHEGAWWISYV